MEGVVFFDFGNVFENHFDQVSKDYVIPRAVAFVISPRWALRFDFGYELNPPDGDYFNPYSFTSASPSLLIIHFHISIARPQRRRPVFQLSHLHCHGTSGMVSLEIDS